jgi:hypothetical protein
MPTFATNNAIVTALGMIALLLFFVFDSATHNKEPEQVQNQTGDVAPTLSYLNYPSLRSAYWYFFGALACVLVSYCLLAIDEKSQDWPTKIKELLHPVNHILKAVVSNTANLSVLIVAIAYARGRDFDPVKARTWLLIYAILIALGQRAGNFFTIPPAYFSRSSS